MKKINSRMILPALTFVTGIVWVVLGITKYGWWSDNGPASGFFPSIIGLILSGISILAILDERGKDSPGYFREHIYPLLAATGIIIAAMIIGFFPALMLFVFGWLKWFEKYSLRFSLVTGTITVLSLYGIFVLWLRVPFPAGLIYNAITG